jgi:hypothetical protein
MIHFLLLVLLAVPQQTAEAPLSAAKIIAAHQAGAQAQMLEQLIDSSTALALPSESELQQMAQAGVPAEVIQKFKTKAFPAPALTTQQAIQPEDARLIDIVKLVKAGLSEDLIVQQIKYAGLVYKMSVNDLIYLKENKIPESIIGELIRTNSTAFNKKEESATKEIKAKQESNTFQPLLYMRGALKKNASGTLMLKEGRFEWLDSKKSDKNYSLQVSSIKTAWLNCSPRPQGNFCFELSLGLFNDDTYSYRDFSWEAGGNTQILALFSTLKENYPQIIFQENVK